MPVSRAALDEKLQHVEPRVGEALVRRGPAALAGVIGRLRPRAPPIPGVRWRIVAGNGLAGGAHRGQERRDTSAASRPGKSRAARQAATWLRPRRLAS